MPIRNGLTNPAVFQICELVTNVAAFVFVSKTAARTDFRRISPEQKADIRQRL